MLNQPSRTGTISTIIAGLAIALGPAIGGFMISQSLKKGGEVVVKGISERQVKADAGSWILRMTYKSNDLNQMEDHMNEERSLLLKDLGGQGFKDDVNVQRPEISEELKFEGDKRVGTIFVYTQSIIIKTNDINLLEKASLKEIDYLKRGIILKTDKAYIFTKFKDTRPEMLAEAIKNARESAEKFAEDAGNKVGKIKNANQGQFSVVSADAPEGGEYDYNEAKSINKRIRVVSTITFALQ